MVNLGWFKRAGVKPAFRHVDFGINLCGASDIPGLAPV
jgi:hypothetical protein